MCICDQIDPVDLVSQTFDDGSQSWSFFIDSAWFFLLEIPGGNAPEIPGGNAFRWFLTLGPTISLSGNSLSWTSVSAKLFFPGIPGGNRPVIPGGNAPEIPGGKALRMPDGDALGTPGGNAFRWFLLGPIGSVSWAPGNR